jgi:ribosomal protein S18 acetylase RimI-like enzyme
MKTGNLRVARAADLPALIELARRSWLSAFAQTAPFGLIAWWAREDVTSRWYEDHWRAMTVLEEDGAIIGLVQPAEAEINGLWVHPAHQGKGAGTLLLRAGEEAILGAGHQKAWLECSAFNPRAVAFYQRRGYVETERRRHAHRSGFEVEDVFLERALATDAAK